MVLNPTTPHELAPAFWGGGGPDPRPPHGLAPLAAGWGQDIPPGPTYRAPSDLRPLEEGARVGQRVGGFVRGVRV